MRLSDELFKPSQGLTAPVEERQTSKGKRRVKLVRKNNGGTETK